MTSNKLLKSLMSVTFLKGIDAIAPLIMIPIAINNFGVKDFGSISFYQTIAIFFAYIVDLGFSIVGLKRINKFSLQKFNYFYFGNALLIKVVIFLILLPLFASAIFYSPIYESDDILLVLAYGVIPFAACFSCPWFYQTFGRYSFLIKVSLSSRLLVVTLAILLINSHKDEFLYTLLYSLMFFIPAVVQFVSYILLGNKVKFKASILLRMVKENIDISIYRFSNAVVLPSYIYMIGLVATSYEIGIFSIFQRLLGVIVNFSVPINQALMPFLMEVKRKSIKNLVQASNKILTILLVVVIGVIVIVMALLGLYYFYFYKSDEVNILVDFGTAVILITVIPHVVNSYITQFFKMVNIAKYNSNVSLITLFFAVILLALSYLLSSYYILIIGYTATYMTTFLYLILNYLKEVSNYELNK